MKIRDLEYKYFRKIRKYKAHYMKARYSGQITGVKAARVLGISGLLISTLFTSGPDVKIDNEKASVQKEEVLSSKAERSIEEEESAKSLPARLPDSPDFNSLSAKSALVIDTQTGAVLYQKQENLPVPPASLTKVMTALIAFESYGLDEVVSVPGECVGLAGNNFGFVSGEEVSVEELLFAMLLGSDSDAACALAAHKTSREEFVMVMNAKADELGLKSTQFLNPIGLHDDNHQSTASDLITLTMKALENEHFEDFVQTKTIEIKGREVKNTNELLSEVTGVTGVKTGYTEEATGCLLLSVNRGNREILAVLLGSEDRFSEMTGLIDWVYRVYSWPKE